jgi:hypothetical protein
MSLRKASKPNNNSISWLHMDVAEDRDFIWHGLSQQKRPLVG